MRLYFDSSVLVKLYKQEEDSEVMDKKPKEIITIDIEDLKLHKIHFISLRDELIPIAERLIKETNLYAADAFHLATFEWINKSEKIDVFLCDDRHFGRLKAFVPVKKPFDLFKIL